MEEFSKERLKFIKETESGRNDSAIAYWKAKIALEQNKIKGCVFEEVEITPFNQEA